MAASPAVAQVAGAPAIPAFGAFFPAWLLCAALGIFGAVIARLVFIRIGLDDVLPWPLAVYTALAVALAVLASSLLFGL
ncbi:YtcA family lipoprotein [Ancylobacter sp. A5.8]|uniref:YtcA family lipoprotein n=1 Tax=Ancylobacter gelatini TaxID=2919920 RepID=UPI001F4DB0F2|nr:YtcA family lipoprotein [Ancylobacter gelatini]MCJ8144478.1 YtcA family lipoprotein [Ancylobacter gelatini]